MTALDELARLFGVEERFTDARGVDRATSSETKRALLAALGADVRDDDAVRRELQTRRDAERRRPIPPVMVVRAGEAVTVTIGADAPRPCDWRLTLEEGSERAGRALGDAIVLGADLPLGYHSLRLEGTAVETHVIVVPPACALPAALHERRGWGLTVQLYLLCSGRNWGLGDLSDLRRLIASVAPRGGDVIGLNPLHAMLLDDPEHASPYSPASRLFLNVLNVDVEAVPEYATCEPAQRYVASETFRAELRRVRGAKSVRYADVAALKLPVLRMLFDGRARSGPRTTAFDDFVRTGGEPLRRACTFQALRSYFAGTAGAPSWRDWPREFQDAAGEPVARFAAQNAEEITYLSWLQFVADEQLGAAAEAARAGGMRIGLYRDLAVGADPGGAEAWSEGAAIVANASVGAPPDIYNPHGQDWGLPPFHPLVLREERYRSFIALIRANMRHAGAVRIDHAMALQHLYLIPHGASPADGAYVSYPREDLLGILALESVRAGCLVVGEDLGTVPAGFRERMAAANVLSYRVLYFETDPETHAFLPPERYPERALAVVSSHDLPTLRAWVHASDIDLKERLQLLDAEAAAEQRAHRAREREALFAALREQGLLAAGDEPDDEALAVAVHAYLARSNSVLAMVQIDDVTQEIDPVNVPATTNEYPNWRRRISLPLERLSADARFAAVTAAFAREGRGRG